MPRRLKPKETKRDWRWWAQTVLNGAVVLSMILGTVFLFAGVPTQRAAPLPTLEVPTLAPPTASPPATPTPKASADFQFAVAGDSRGGDVVFTKLLQRVMNDGNAPLIHTATSCQVGQKTSSGEDKMT